MVTVHQIDAPRNAAAWPAWTDCISAELPPADWFAAQVELYRGRDDFHAIIADALEDVRRGLSWTHAATPADYVRATAGPLRHLDLAGVRVPEGERHSRMGDLFDEQAQYYLDLSTDLGRLAASAILVLAAGAEFHGANTTQEFIDGEAAFHAAEEAIIDEQFHPSW